MPQYKPEIPMPPLDPEVYPDIDHDTESHDHPEPEPKTDTEAKPDTEADEVDYDLISRRHGVKNEDIKSVDIDISGSAPLRFENGRLLNEQGEIMEEAMRRGGAFEAKELVNLHWLEKNLAKDGIDCGEPFEYNGRTVVIFSKLNPDGTIKASFHDIGPAKEKLGRESYTPSEPEQLATPTQKAVEKVAHQTPPAETLFTLDIGKFWKELEAAEVSHAHHTESSVMGLSAPATAAETRVAAELTADDASVEPAVAGNEEAFTATAEAVSRNEGVLAEVVSGAATEQSPAVAKQQEVVTQFTETTISAPVEARSEQTTSIQPETTRAESVETPAVVPEKAVVIESTTEAEPVVVQTTETATAEVATTVKPEAVEVRSKIVERPETVVSGNKTETREIRAEVTTKERTQEAQAYRTEKQEVGPRTMKIEEAMLRSFGARGETLRRFYDEARKPQQTGFVPVAEERRREIILEEDPESGIKLVQVA